MLNLPALIIGFIVAMVLSIMGGLNGLYGSAVGVLITGMIVGHMVNGDILNGITHGALIGMGGAVFLSLIALLLGNISSLLAHYIGVATIGSIILAIIVGAVGGAIGSLIKHWI